MVAQLPCVSDIHATPCEVLHDAHAIPYRASRTSSGGSWTAVMEAVDFTKKRVSGESARAPTVRITRSNEAMAPVSSSLPVSCAGRKLDGVSLQLA